MAAGEGRRLGADRPKQFLEWQGQPLYWHSARVSAQSGVIGGIVFVFPKAQLSEESARLEREDYGPALGIPWLAVQGGTLRQDSVRLGLQAVPSGIQSVLVHDSARPFLSAALIRQLCSALASGLESIIPVIKLTDTIKQLSSDGKTVEQTLPREHLCAVQTPQAFQLALLRKAHQQAVQDCLQVTDDASLLEILGLPVHTIPGDPQNIKITGPGDLRFLDEPSKKARFCVGHGYDVHLFGSGRPLKLGGIAIPNAPEIVAHSDGDVLLHALMDALLGCAGLGDIGEHFPDSDSRFAGISSALLLDHVLDLLREKAVIPCQVDLTVVAQKPHIAPWKMGIRRNVARLLSLGQESVNIKATTEEGLGFTGRMEGIKAYAVVSALKNTSL